MGNNDVYSGHNVIASQPSKRRPTWMSTACAKTSDTNNIYSPAPHESSGWSPNLPLSLHNGLNNVATCMFHLQCWYLHCILISGAVAPGMWTQWVICQGKQIAGQGKLLLS